MTIRGLFQTEIYFQRGGGLRPTFESLRTPTPSPQMLAFNERVGEEMERRWMDKAFAGQEARLAGRDPPTGGDNITLERKERPQPTRGKVPTEDEDSDD